MIKTEFDFVLPVGFQDDDGQLHRAGRMRMATAMDEIVALRDPRVRQDEAYLVITLLSQVITELGTFQSLQPKQVERLFARDVAYLQNLYRQINDEAPQSLHVRCPHCGQTHEVEVPFMGE